MRQVWIGLISALLVVPAWARTEQQRDGCSLTNPASDQIITSCTALIDSGHASRADLAMGFNNRGVASKRKGLYDQAFADFTQAIAPKPDYAHAFAARALSHHKKGEDVRALPDADRAVTLAPRIALYLNMRAEFYERLGRRVQAVADD